MDSAPEKEPDPSLSHLERRLTNSRLHQAKVQLEGSKLLGKVLRLELGRLDGVHNDPDLLRPRTVSLLVLVGGDGKVSELASFDVFCVLSLKRLVGEVW